MAQSPKYCLSDTRIEIVDGMGEWFVRIVKNGKQTAVLSFESEEFALSYAEGQRIGLGLAPDQMSRLSA